MRLKKFVIPILCFLLGVLVMYLYNWNWVINNKTLTEDLVVSFRENYDIQERQKKNYYDTYMLLSDMMIECLAKTNKCNYEDAAKEVKKIEMDREGLNSQLDSSNQKIETILSKFPQKKD